jgi:hypothetical protein
LEQFHREFVFALSTSQPALSGKDFRVLRGDSRRGVQRRLGVVQLPRSQCGSADRDQQRDIRAFGALKDLVIPSQGTCRLARRGVETGQRSLRLKVRGLLRQQLRSDFVRGGKIARLALYINLTNAVRPPDGVNILALLWAERLRVKLAQLGRQLHILTGGEQ